MGKRPLSSPVASTAKAALAVLVVMGALVVSGGASAGTAWTAALAINSNGLAASTGVPAAPSGVSAACSGTLLAPTITVTWNSVARANSYAVLKSTTSSSSGFSQVATGVTAVTWTSGTLPSGNYWFEIDAYSGTYWVSANSASTSKITILLGISCL